jgi:hypothetical protein
MTEQDFGYPKFRDAKGESLEQVSTAISSILNHFHRSSCHPEASVLEGIKEMQSPTVLYLNYMRISLCKVMATSN